jgi:prepilin signal peptidase PulO-like enzyme (type II secretory pathway)
MIAGKCGISTELFAYTAFFGVSMFLALCDRKTMTVPVAGLVLCVLAGILRRAKTGIDAQEIFLDVMTGTGWMIWCLAESRIFQRESAGIGDGFYLAAAGLALSGRIAAGGLIAGSLIGITECLLTQNRKIPFLPSLAEGLFLVWIWKG